MLRQTLAGFVVAFALLFAPATTRAQPPATTAAQDGFVPVDETKPQEQLPAAPLLMSAYARGWRSSATSGRSGRVSRESSAEIAEVSRRVDAGSRWWEMGEMTAAHFIFIPSVLLIGIVIGWVLGSRAARDAFAAELRKREDREKRRAAK